MSRRLAPIRGHAADQMRERKISVEEAQHVLDNAHTDLPAEIEGARLLIGHVGPRTVAIVVKPLGDDLYRLCTTWAKGE